MKDNDYLRWHFDQSDFVVSIPLQDSESGGEFEFVRHIRSKDAENYDDVAAILRGGTKNVERMRMPPGSLILFEGRYTLHRVTRIKGQTPRLIALLSYDTKPDTDSSDYLKMIRYGRLAK
jgi:predicted 2-oxoglutarate/Fe(II)-dependent dioxygenase YbiX